MLLKLACSRRNCGNICVILSISVKSIIRKLIDNRKMSYNLENVVHIFTSILAMPEVCSLKSHF